MRMGGTQGKSKTIIDHLQKYYVKSDNKFEDYVGEDDIDMVEVCVI